MYRRIITIVTLIMAAMTAVAWNDANAEQARRIFDKAYGMVFGQQGASLHYDVNIIGVYKTSGDIWYKGKKSKFADERVDAWNDGTTAYMVYRKKKVVEIHDAASDKKDKYSGKFKFTLDDFDYNMSRQKDGIMLILKQRKGAKGTIKEVKALVDEKTYVPKKLRVKVYFFWTTIAISNFKQGGVTDQTFVFPRKRYASGYKFVDKRRGA